MNITQELTLSQAIFILALSQIGDAVTTLRILAKGGRELNPLIRWMMGRLGTAPALLVKGLVLVLIGAVAGSTDTALIMAGITACAVVWNIFVLVKMP